MEIVTSPMAVQVAPSLDAAPEKVFPERTIFTHAGTLRPGPQVSPQPEPVIVRYCSEVPLAGVTTVIANFESGFSVSRIMTPDFAHESVLSSVRTRAVIWPSPTRGWYANWKASAVSQMSCPDPYRVNVPEV